MGSPGARVATIAVLADDLIWGTRLATTIDAFEGWRATRIRTRGGLDAWLSAGDRTPEDAVIVDLTARAYDGVAAISAAVARDVRTLAVGQHDDLELRKLALAAGADRVYAYRKLFEDGPATLRRWLGVAAGAEASKPVARG